MLIKKYFLFWHKISLIINTKYRVTADLYKGEYNKHRNVNNVRNTLDLSKKLLDYVTYLEEIQATVSNNP